jgi:hypothetical protein
VRALLAAADATAAPAIAAAAATAAAATAAASAAASPTASGDFAGLQALAAALLAAPSTNAASSAGSSAYAGAGAGSKGRAGALTKLPSSSTAVNSAAPSPARAAGLLAAYSAPHAPLARLLTALCALPDRLAVVFRGPHAPPPPLLLSSLAAALAATDTAVAEIILPGAGAVAECRSYWTALQTQQQTQGRRSRAPVQRRQQRQQGQPRLFPGLERACIAFSAQPAAYASGASSLAAFPLLSRPVIFTSLAVAVSGLASAAAHRLTRAPAAAAAAAVSAAPTAAAAGGSVALAAAAATLSRLSAHGQTPAAAAVLLTRILSLLQPAAAATAAGAAPAPALDAADFAALASVLRLDPTARAAAMRALGAPDTLLRPPMHPRARALTQQQGPASTAVPAAAAGALPLAQLRRWAAAAAPSQLDPALVGFVANSHIISGTSSGAGARISAGAETAGAAVELRCLRACVYLLSPARAEALLGTLLTVAATAAAGDALVGGDAAAPGTAAVHVAAYNPFVAGVTRARATPGSAFVPALLLGSEASSAVAPATGTLALQLPLLTALAAGADAGATTTGPGSASAPAPADSEPQPLSLAGAQHVVRSVFAFLLAPSFVQDTAPPSGGPQAWAAVAAALAPAPAAAAAAVAGPAPLLQPVSAAVRHLLSLHPLLPLSAASADSAGAGAGVYAAATGAAALLLPARASAALTLLSALEAAGPAIAETRAALASVTLSAHLTSSSAGGGGSGARPGQKALVAAAAAAGSAASAVGAIAVAGVSTPDTSAAGSGASLSASLASSTARLTAYVTALASASDLAALLAALSAAPAAAATVAEATPAHLAGASSALVAVSTTEADAPRVVILRLPRLPLLPVASAPAGSPAGPGLGFGSVLDSVLTHAARLWGAAIAAPPAAPALSGASALSSAASASASPGAGGEDAALKRRTQTVLLLLALVHRRLAALSNGPFAPAPKAADAAARALASTIPAPPAASSPGAGAGAGAGVDGGSPAGVSPFLTHPAVPSLMSGVQLLMSSPSTLRRGLGMAVAEAFAAIADPARALALLSPAAPALAPEPPSSSLAPLAARSKRAVSRRAVLMGASPVQRLFTVAGSAQPGALPTLRTLAAPAQGSPAHTPMQSSAVVAPSMQAVTATSGAETHTQTLTDDDAFAADEDDSVAAAAGTMEELRFARQLCAGLWLTAAELLPAPATATGKPGASTNVDADAAAAGAGRKAVLLPAPAWATLLRGVACLARAPPALCALPPGAGPALMSARPAGDRTRARALFLAARGPAAAADVMRRLPGAPSASTDIGGSDDDDDDNDEAALFDEDDDFEEDEDEDEDDDGSASTDDLGSLIAFEGQVAKLEALLRSAGIDAAGARGVLAAAYPARIRPRLVSGPGAPAPAPAATAPPADTDFSGAFDAVAAADAAAVSAVLPGFSLTDDARDLRACPPPRSLRECVGRLQGQDRAALLSGLAAAAPLIRAAAPVSVVDGAPLLRELTASLIALGSSSLLPAPGAAVVRARARALVACVVVAPTVAAAALSAELTSSARSLQDRLDVLDALAAAAAELGQLDTSIAGGSGSGTTSVGPVKAGARANPLISMLEATETAAATANAAADADAALARSLAAPERTQAEAPHQRGGSAKQVRPAALALNASHLTPAERAAVAKWNVEAKTVRRPLAAAAAAAAAAGGATVGVNRFAPLAYRTFFLAVVGRVDVSYVARQRAARQQRELLLAAGEFDDSESSGLGGVLGTAGMTHVTMLSQDPLLLARTVHTLAVFVQAAGLFCNDGVAMAKDLLDIALAARSHPEPAIRRAAIVAFITVADTLPFARLTDDLAEQLSDWMGWLKQALEGAERDEHSLILAREALVLCYKKYKDE